MSQIRIAQGARSETDLKYSPHNHHIILFATITFKSLQQASIFSKLNLHSTYSLIWVRQGYVKDTVHHALGQLRVPGDFLWADERFAILQCFIKKILRETLNHYTFLSGWYFDLQCLPATFGQPLLHETQEVSVSHPHCSVFRACSVQDVDTSGAGQLWICQSPPIQANAIFLGLLCYFLMVYGEF